MNGVQLNLDSSIYVAGHRGMVGSAVVRALRARGYRNLLVRSRAELDLTDQRAVRDFFSLHTPQAVILTAARVGGIHANATRPGAFIRDNLLIQTNVIDAAHRSGVGKFVFLGSSCVYPRLARQPIKEEYLLTGELEPTNEPYAIAKIAGLKMCEAYRREFGFNAISVMPTNLYGPGDNFDLLESHVMPALIRRFHEARRRADASVTVWGSGTPRREFLHVDDLADAVAFLLESYEGESAVNVGWGEDVTVRELALLIARVAGFQGQVLFDPTKPDGTPRKLLDISRLARLGWRPQIRLELGVERTYAWFQEHVEGARL